MNTQRYRQTITRSAACAELAERVDIEEAWALAEEEDKTPPEIGGALQLRNGRILSHFSTGFFLSPRQR